MRFIADVMLGRLARWLRLMGFDVLYDRHADDRDLIRIARAEGRTLLTRDTHLARRKGLDDVVLIESDEVQKQLLQLRGRLDHAAAEPTGRCDVCNGVLEEVSLREDVRSLVPEYVYRTAPSFRRCPSCGRVYWPGSHSRSFQARLRMTEDRHEG